MLYKRKDITVTNRDNKIEMVGVRDFDPDQIFDCGQCFRWQKISGDVWRGIVGERIAEVSYDAHSKALRIVELTKDADPIDFWWNYFDLDRDYGEIKAFLCESDPVMREAVKKGSGIRILRQDFWETLISFIISQNNNIPRIKKCINSLAASTGELIETKVVKDREINVEPSYALPEAAKLASKSEEDLACCSLGYRDKYLLEAAKQYLDRGDTRACEDVSELREFCGVGPKVANCVALFGLGLIDSFPIDIWMKRVMNELYGISESDTKAMKQYADEHFSPYGGIAQQYLFYYITHK